MRDGADQKQHHLIKVLYTAFSQILPQDKMFIYGHSGESTPEVRIYHDKYNTTFAQTINSQMNNDYNENYDGPVIENIYERVRQQTSDNIIFLSISDGEPAGEDYGGSKAIEEMKRVIEKCKRDGFVTVGIGLKHKGVKEIYQYHTVVKDLNDLVKNVSSLVNRVVKTEFKD
jgi:nitric oxide reductase activation protein